jgi:DNA-binding CsgD family transcriptional regulator/tetratricopeptide (TPR) repeat protein
MIATSPFAGEIDAGWAALRRGAWDEARAAFAAVVAQADVAEAYDGLGYAAWWVHDVETLFAARERAYRLYRRAGDARAAAGVAIWIASDHVDFRGDHAIANGWLRRARRLLDGLEVAPEHGWLAAHEAFAAIIDRNDVVAGRQLGATAAQLGRTLGSVDLEAVGMATEGLALVTQGQVAAGMPLLDEAAATALSGEFEHLWAVPWTCCFLIYACERVHDLERAEQWCRKVEEFARQTSIEFTWGLCRAHHAGVLVWQGAWDEAERELGDAAGSLQRSRPIWGVETTVRLGELRRRQGRLSEAAALFKIADSHPLALVGLAELCLDRGDWRGAFGLGERILRKAPPESRTEQLPGLQILVRALAAMGDHERSRQVLAELEALATLVPTSLVRATASFCSGVVARAQDDLAAAKRRFEDAVDLYAQAGVPYEEARTRLELAAIEAASGRLAAAAEEADRARQVLVRLGAVREAERAAMFAGPGRRRDTGRAVLTPRERQVLQLVAQGMTDAEIAASLELSRHTVHRHVANILTKLNCSTRAAAVAAASRGLTAMPTG